MRRLALLVLLALVALSSCAATLRVTASAPTFDNDGTCGSPVLLPATAGAPRVLHFQWSGPASGEDSVATIVGAPVTFSRNVPAGTYTVRGWASSSGGAGCDTTVSRTLVVPPWRVVFQ